MSSTNGELPPPGTTIQIPVLNAVKGFDGSNMVYNPAGTIDNYGHDIAIDTNGRFCVTGADFGTTSGAESLRQSVLNRLSTALGSRIRLLAYGIRANIGSSDNTLRMVITRSIESTLMADPRIRSVDNIEFRGKGDSLKVYVTYTDLNGSQNSFGGVFR